MLLKNSTALWGVRDVFEWKVASFKIASVCAFLCGSGVSSCDTNLTDLVFVVPFFGEADRDTEHEEVESISKNLLD